jgi:replicative DNA helicase
VASLEMSHEDVTERVISLFGIPGDQVQAGDVDDAYSERLNEALVAIASWDFEVIDNETLTPHDLMRAQRRGNYDLLIIDHLHHMKIDRRHERESIGENVHGITELARRFEIPVLLLAQLSRGPKEAPFPRPTKRDLYGASQIENYASHIWLVWRRPDEFNDFTSQTEFVIAANRFGWSGRDASRELLFRNRFVRFEEPHQTEGES